MRESINTLISNQKKAVNNRDEKNQEHLDEVSNNEKDSSVGSIGNSFTDYLEGSTENAIGNTDTIYSNDLDQDYTKYQDDIENNRLDIEDLSNIENIAAQNQSGLETASKFVARTGLTAVAETLKGFGYLAGGVGYLAQLAIPGVESDIKTMTNNFFIEGMDSLTDEIKAKMPVWVSDEIKNGTLTDKLFSGEMWANEGADGLGFLFSSLGIGGAFNKLGKAINLNNKITMGLTAGSQTIVEAAAETSGLSKELDSYWEGNLLESGMYKAEDGTELSLEEVNEIKKNALHGAFIKNAVLLAGPNMILSNSLFGKGKSNNSLLGGSKKFKGSTLDEIKENLAKQGNFKNQALEYGKEGLKVSSSEAFQEWSQFAIEDYSKKIGENIQDKGLIEGLFESYNKGLNDVDGQLSIALGGIFGGGSSIVGSYRQSKENAKNRGKLSELISKTSSDYSNNLASLYKTNKKGELELDSEKIKDIVDSNIGNLTIEDIYKKAREEGNKKTAKQALGMIAIGQALPFFSQDEEMTIFDKVIDENDETYENDYQNLGFNSKDEMKNYLKNSVKIARDTYTKYTKDGPISFGLTKKILSNSTLEKAETDIIYNQFYEKLTKIAVYNNAVKQGLSDDLSFVRNQIIERKAELEKTKKKDDNVDDLLKKDLTTLLLEKKENLILESFDKNNKEFELLFDKKEQKTALESMIKDSIDLKQSIKEEKEKEIKEKAEVDEFYKNLEDKGYNVKSKNDGGTELSDFTKDVIALIDTEGNVYKVGKRIVKGKAEFVIKNVETNETTPFNAKLLGSKFKGIDAIMSKEDFSAWKRAKRVLNLNQKKLETLNDLVENNSESKIKAIESIEKLNEEVAFYKEYLEDLLNSEPTNLSKLIENIKEAEDILNTITAQVENLRNTVETLEEAKDILLDLKSQLEQVIEENKATETSINFSFQAIYQEIKDEMSNSKIDTQIEDLDTTIEYAEIVLDEWINVQVGLEDIVNDLYKTVANQNYLKYIIPNLTDEQLKKISNLRYFRANELSQSDIEELGFENLTQVQLFEKLQPAFFVSGTREKLLEILNKNQLNDLSTFQLKLNELNNIKIKVKKAKIKLDKIVKYKSLKAKENLMATMLLNIKRNYNLKGSEDKVLPEGNQKKNTKEQDNINDPKSYTAKETPFSTTTSFWDFKNGEINYDNGNNGKNTNWKESGLFSKAMMTINNNDIDNYHVRFLNPSDFKSLLGFTPPSSDENDIYAVIYEKGELFKFEGKVPYTGIGKPSTYFNQSENRISLRKNLDYRKAQSLKEKLGDDFKYTYKEKEYFSLENLETDILNEIEKQYTDWRKSLVEKLSKGPIYAPTTNISRGMPQFDMNKDVNASEVFKEVDEIIIPDKNTIGIGEKVVQVKPGMVYVKDKNGQISRVLNRRIDSLPQKKKEEVINKIIKFMAMSYFVEGNLSQKIEIKGTKQSYPLLGSSKNGGGVLDFFINWGESDEKGFGMFVGKHKENNEKYLVINTNFNGVKNKEFIELKDMFNGIPSDNNVKLYGDPTIKSFTDFLETKFLNVNRQSLMKSSDLEAKQKSGYTGWWMPTDIKLEGKGKDKKLVLQVDRKKYKSYNDYVMENVLYTNIDNKDNTDEIPIFTNQYITFNENALSDKINKPTVLKSKPEGLFERLQNNNKDEAGFEDFTPFDNDSPGVEFVNSFKDFKNKGGVIPLTDSEGNLSSDIMSKMALFNDEVLNTKENEEGKNCEIPKSATTSLKKSKNIIKGDNLDI